MRAAIIVLLKQAFLRQQEVTLATLAQLLNTKFREEKGVSLTVKISEKDFIVLVNQMVAAQDIIQIKNCLSVL